MSELHRIIRNFVDQFSPAMKAALTERGDDLVKASRNYNRVDFTVGRGGAFMAVAKGHMPPVETPGVGDDLAAMIREMFPASSRPVTLQFSGSPLKPYSLDPREIRICGESFGRSFTSSGFEEALAEASVIATRLDGAIPPSNQPLKFWSLGYSLSGMSSVSTRGVFARSPAEAVLKMHVYRGGSEALDGVLSGKPVEFLKNMNRRWLVSRDVIDDPSSPWPVFESLDDDIASLEAHLKSLGSESPEP